MHLQSRQITGTRYAVDLTKLSPDDFINEYQNNMISILASLIEPI